MAKVLKVGVIGCGEAAQLLHIPSLRELADQFQIAALCDVSRTVVDGVGASLPWASRHTDAEELLRLQALDVVLLTCPNAWHAPLAIAAMQAGKHVLIEKPMCMTLREADALAETESGAGVVAQVGYMRRHAPAFEEAVALVNAEGSRINHARVGCFIGPNAAIIESTSAVIRGDDAPEAELARTKAENDARLIEAIGSADGPRALVYTLMLGLSTHDISAMRELIGMPKGVLYAAFRGRGWFYSAAFDYGDFICTFETGIDTIARVEAYVEVNMRGRTVRVDYDTPYVRHLPARLTVTEPNTKHGVTVSQGHATRGDAFVVEWRRLHDAITQGLMPKTSIADARQDLELFADMMALL
jgi:predicted dehydrogenase